MTQTDKANYFNAMHQKGDPLVLFNIWDAGSAKALCQNGTKAIATSSWSVAASQGYEDGEIIPFDYVVANLKRIVSCVNLPVSIDLEGGYAETESQLHETIIAIIATGAIGINFEDQIIGGDQLYSTAEQCARIRAIRRAATSQSVPLFINARTDIFLKIDPSEHSESHLEEARIRASAYATAGADGFFVPGLQDEKMIRKLCEASPIPVNIMTSPNGITPSRLSELGVSRVSYGPSPYCSMIERLQALTQP